MAWTIPETKLLRQYLPVILSVLCLSLSATLFLSSVHSCSISVQTLAHGPNATKTKDMGAQQTTSCSIQLSRSDAEALDINKYNMVTLDELLKDGNISHNGADVLFIQYSRTPIIVYSDMYKDLYKTESDADRIQARIRGFPGKRLLGVHDIHNYTFMGGFETLYTYVATHNIDLVVGNYCGNEEYETIREGLLKHTGVPVVTIPNLVDHGIFYDRHLQKQWDILLYGHLDPDAYPFRYRLSKILIRNRLQWKTKVLEYNDVQKGELSSLINQASLTVVTRSRYDYLLYKYFEISFSNSCLVGNIPTQGEALFQDNYIHLDESMDDETIENTIDEALQNRKHLEELASKNLEAVQMYSVEYRKHYLTKALDSIFDQGSTSSH